MNVSKIGTIRVGVKPLGLQLGLWLRLGLGLWLVLGLGGKDRINVSGLHHRYAVNLG